MPSPNKIRKQVFNSLPCPELLCLHWSIGPGDTLRMVHALRCLPVPTSGAVVLTRWQALDRLPGIWSGTPQDRDDTPEYWSVVRDGNVFWVAKTPWGITDWDEPMEKRDWDPAWAMWNVQLLLRTLQGGWARIVHPFVWAESPTIMYRPARWAGIKRQRVDRNSLMRTKRFDGRPYELCQARTGEPLRVLLVWRQEKKEPSRNTPDWLGTLVERIARQSGAVVEHWAAKQPPGVQSKLHLFGNGSYLDQIQFLATSYDCAIGVTSGGLDLAAAAGLPILRIAEFQGVGYNNGGGPMKGLWGASYNSFLANDLNIGLSFGSVDADKFDTAIAEKSVDEFIAYIKGTPRHERLRRHLLLPEGTPFERRRIHEFNDHHATPLDVQPP